jgi:hypothetical protein
MKGSIHVLVGIVAAMLGVACGSPVGGGAEAHVTAGGVRPDAFMADPPGDPSPPQYTLTAPGPCSDLWLTSNLNVDSTVVLAFKDTCAAGADIYFSMPGDEVDFFTSVDNVSAAAISFDLTQTLGSTGQFFIGTFIPGPSQSASQCTGAVCTLYTNCAELNSTYGAGDCSCSPAVVQSGGAIYVGNDLVVKVPNLAAGAGMYCTTDPGGTNGNGGPSRHI